MGRKEKEKAKAKKAVASSSSEGKAVRKDKKPGGKAKGGGPAYGDPLERELAAVGLRVAKITADGNCLFRAVGDQTEGDEGRHVELRQRACDLMEARREGFEPFVEDDQGFDTYIKRMRKDGVWGGHMELQALSLLAGANIYVYQEGQPRWTVRNHPDSAPSIHISYHGGEHYNSVRLLDDYSRGPPRAIVLGEGGATAAELAQERTAWTPADEARVAANTGCDSPALVQRALREAGGDVDSALERVIEVMAGGGDEGGGDGDGGGGGDGCGGSGDVGGGSGGGEGSDAAVGSRAEGDSERESRQQARQGASGSSQGEQQQEEQEQQQQQEEQQQGEQQQQQQQQQQQAELASGDGKGGGAKGGAKGKGGKAKRGVEVGPSGPGIGKKPARNKTCPCGSGKKWKGCCGAAAAAAERRQRALQGEAADAAQGGGVPAMLATLHI
ncbi:MAG: hypothetical protein J3K34DRAFT_515825 [Monoraphidium minutum]|nr:MAG: hypothetical protein J3K34DRAFT_515825 [Monoraphidium minutum]